jgi:hypothetical protein
VSSRWATEYALKERERDRERVKAGIKYFLQLFSEFWGREV